MKTSLAKTLRKKLRMRYVVVMAILIYQRYISPYKGYSCAYKGHTGCASCSMLGMRAVRLYGVIGGFVILRRRFRLCRMSAQRFSTIAAHRHSYNFQRGECDILVWIGFIANSVMIFDCCCSDGENKNTKSTDPSKFNRSRYKKYQEETDKRAKAYYSEDDKNK